MSRPELRQVVPYASDYMSCETQCVAAVLQYQGQGPLCVLYGKDWGFYHFRGQGPDRAHLVLGSWRRPDEDWREEHGIRLQVRRSRDPGRAWQGLEALLDRGQPAVVLTDAWYLPYATSYHARHQLHFFIVNGCDLDRGEVYVADGLFAYQGPVSLEVLAEARGRGGDGVHPAGKWLEMEPPAGPAPGLEELVARALRRNRRALLGVRPPALSRAVRQGVERRGALRAGSGLSGLRGFAQCVGREELSAGELMDLFNQTVVICEQRMWHGQFLIHAGRALGLGSLVEAGQGLEMLAQSWLVARNLFFKASREAPAPDIRRRAEKRLLDIADAEERVLGLVSQGGRELVGRLSPQGGGGAGAAAGEV